MIWIFLIKTDNALCFLLSNVAVYFIVWIVLELNCRKLIGSKNDGNAPLREESKRLEIASDNVYSIFRKTNEMKSDLAWKREWEANVREKARQEQARQEQRERQPKRKKRSYDMSL